MKFLLSCFLLAGIAASAYAVDSISATNWGGRPQVGDIIFQDEFDYFNRDLWKYEINLNGGGNNEFQIYDNGTNNAYVRDGILYMRPTLTLDDRFNGNYEQLYNGEVNLAGCTDSNGCYRKGQYPNILPPVQSARLRTQGSFSFKYGRVEVRARMPSGDWVWPAIWMLPEEWKYGSWPQSGEIDIVESRGNRNLKNSNGVNIGSEQMGSTLHYGPKWPYNGWWAAHGDKNTAPNQGFDRDFHIYGVEWTDSYIKFTVDGDVVKNVVPGAGGFYALGQFPQGETTNIWANGGKMAPFDQAFHFILNVAVGGSYFPTDSNPSPPWAGGQDPDQLEFWNARNQWLSTWGGEDAAMQIDYIRVYAV